MSKYNDKRSELSISDGEVQLFNRHKSFHKTFTLTDSLRNEIITVCRDILHLDISKWSYLDGGLLDGKNKHISGMFVIWDILVREGDWLIGSTYQERYDWLLTKAKAAGNESFFVTINEQKFDFGIKLSEHIFIPRFWDTFESCWEFTKLVNAAAGWTSSTDGEAILEGIVLKNPKGVLKPDCGRPENNTSWSARSRICTKRSRF
jgi:hypothetical protein